MVNVIQGNASYHWYPVCTRPRAEKKVKQALESKGITCYLPLQRQLKQWSDRKKWVEEPLIKSYVFVRIAAYDLGRVLMTPGVARFIYFGGKVAAMPDRQIADLRLLMTSAVDLEVTEEDLLPGEKIIVRAGPLKGMTGEMVSYRSQKVVAMRFEGLGCSIIIQVPASLITRF
jgi:transcription antitermination factor NusG